MTSPDLSNNPFLNDQSNPHIRFPDIRAGQSTGFQPNANPSPGYGYGYSSGNFSSSNVPQFQSQQQQQYYPSQSPSQYGGFGYSPSPVTFQPTGYQPTVYGQSPYQAQASYQQQPQQPYVNYSTPQGSNYQGYSTPQYQAQPSAYLSEFDPYSNNNSARGQSPYDVSPGPSQSQNTLSGRTAQGSSRTHPRDYIRTHKAELEIWDEPSWRQLLSCFDELRTNWEGRKGQISAQLRQGGYHLSSQDSFRLQEMQKEADRNIDSIAASFFQLKEVHAGYRHSGDLASKNRVRESVNAAVQGLPDWPV